MAVYDIDGNLIGIDSEKNLDYDMTVLSVNHRGYSTVAPENTLPAYILSKKMGFNYVETDVSFTSDGVAVLLHDSTIDRTSNGTGDIGSMTFNQVRQYDFGSWKSSAYAGTQIPSLAEFLALCRAIMLHPYIELKSNGGYTQAQIEGIVDMVKAYGLKGKVTYISFSETYLGYVKNYDAEARLGFLKGTYASGDVAVCTGLRTAGNRVFYDVNYAAITQAVCEAFAAADIPVEAWTVDSESTMLGLNSYVSGITSDNLIAGKVLYDDAMD
jgi:glycerophosphoryl diester phosphodiesterase